MKISFNQINSVLTIILTTTFSNKILILMKIAIKIIFSSSQN